MSCKDLDLFLSGSGRLPAEAEEHLRSCDRCRGLAKAIGESDPVATVDPALMARLQTSAAEHLRPVSPLPSPGFFVGVFLVILLAIAFAGVARFGMSGFHALGLGRKIVVFSLLGVSACILAVAVARQMTPGSRKWMNAGPLAGGIIAVLLTAFALLFHNFDWHAFTSGGTWCLRTGIECAIPAGFLIWLFLRRGLLLNPVSAGALAGALSGLVGLTMLELLCPIFNAFHILFWHAGVMILATVAGAAIGFLMHWVRN
ncbi:MAG: NrsF family protein [Bryobacteraceae bacterium]